MIETTCNTSLISGPALWTHTGPVAAAYHARGEIYEPRAAQAQFAVVIEQAISKQLTQSVGILPIEGGTGIGKTLAYLVPGVLHVAANDGRMLISTHTVALGVQILRKDGPIAQAVAECLTGKQPRIAHMRGRSHFVSPSRARALGNLIRDDGLPASKWRPYLDVAEEVSATLTRAAEALSKGDNSENTQRLVESALIERIQESCNISLAAEEICLLGSSPDDELAIHKLSRVLASKSNILVTTHAYTAIALARNALFGAAKDPFSLLVIDEADQWSSVAASMSLVRVSLMDLRSGIENILKANRHASTPARLQDVACAAIEAVDILKAAAPTNPNETMPISKSDPSVDILSTLGDRIEALLEAAAKRRSHTAAAADDLQKKLGDLRRIQRAFLANESDYWVARWTTSRVQGLPSIGITGRAPGRIIKRLWENADGADPLARTIVLTSATLTTPGFGERAQWKAIEIATGADPSNGMVLTELATSIQPSDFGRMRVRFADPRAPIPRITDKGVMSTESLAYVASVINAARNDSELKNGRTLVLVPSYADVHQLHSVLSACLFHTQGTRLQKVLDTYRANPGCCLVTPGAWIGADLPGLIQNLVIARLPFPPIERDRAFNIAGVLSSTLSKLAQGIGRGLRSNTDDVNLWFADPRVALPESLIEETGILPAREANSIFLSAIPKRIRETFETVAGTARIGVLYDVAVAGEDN